jgi:predicted dehydrogenase
MSRPSRPGAFRFDYQYPDDETIKVGFIGCGGHSYRHIYPTFQFAPIRLVATCDLFEDRAKWYAKKFGADRYYTDYHKMLSKEDLDAVFVVTGFDRETGLPTYPPIVMDCMNAGCHVWEEKPPADDVATIEKELEISKKTGKFVVIGFKNAFYPSVQKMKEITEQKDFSLTTISVRYGGGNYIAIPTAEDMKDPKNRTRFFFLDILDKPFAVLNLLGGKMEHIYYERNATNGGGFVTIRFMNGVIGMLHCAKGQSETSVCERFEAIGKDSNIIVDNGIKFAYYRQSGPRANAGFTQYFPERFDASIYWEPEFTKGQLHNRNLMLLGYWGEVYYFAKCVLENTRPKINGLEDALEYLKFFEAFKEGEKKIIEIN